MQIECRTSNLFECYAEMPLILYKDSASRMQRKEFAQFSLLRRSLSYAKIVHVMDCQTKICANFEDWGDSVTKMCVFTIKYKQKVCFYEK